MKGNNMQSNKLKLSSFALCAVAAVAHFSAFAEFKMDRSVMSDAYWKIWNDDVQKRIDADIEKYRKADAEVALEGIPDGTEVAVEQVSHAFFFGAHTFNFNQLGSKEFNDRYKALWGTLFNSGTVAFYWKTLEPYRGKIRYEESERDTEAFWNSCKEPWKEPHWRRPPPDPVIAFLREKGCRVHGHPLAWGNNAFQTPSWIWDELCPQSEKDALKKASGILPPGHNPNLPMGVKEPGRDEGKRKGVTSWPRSWVKIFEKLSPDEVAKLCPTYFENFNRLTFERIRHIAARYGSVVDSWDVCNESYRDFRGKSATGKPFQVSKRYGITAGDLCYNAFKIAQESLPKTALLNINDYSMNADFGAQINDLMANGCRIDVIGSQMHLFNPAESKTIAAGKYSKKTIYNWVSPEGIAESMANLTKWSGGLPIHLSEITITAPDATPKGEMMQAIIMRNLYRAWFSVEKMHAITWWNVVDSCGAPSEPSFSGIFTRDMKPKAAYYAMDDLINREWKTKTTVKAKNGKVAFRGFKGRYRVSWKGPDGTTQSKLVDVK